MFVWRLFVLIKRRLLWRVRRKLILSYIFIGVIPSLLILVFFLFGSAVLFMNVSAYLFKNGYDKVVDDAKVVAQAAAAEIAAIRDRVADDRARAPDPVPSVSGALGRLRRADGTSYTARAVGALAGADRLCRAWLKDDLFAGSLALAGAGQRPTRRS